MLAFPRAKWAGLALAVLAIAAAVAIGLLLRLADPLSSSVIPAEDPYTHMALVREHLRTGMLEPLYANGGLYPPGLHAYLAAMWSYTGIDLYQVVLLGPVILGAIGVVGMGLLLWRNQGPLAAFVGALALAVAPEAIFRTNMMSPTALDMALLPYLVLALLELTKGKLAWAGVAAPMTLFFVFSHPWLFPILALLGVAFIALALALPWEARYRTFSPVGAGVAIACVGTGLGLTLSTCGGLCGPGLRDIMSLPQTSFFHAVPYLVIAASLTPLALLRPGLRERAEALARAPRRRPVWLRLTASIALAAAFAAITLAALRNGMPELVDLPKMFGWPILILAVAGLIALPFLASPSGHAGAALTLATYPFVVFNPLHSPFWPHRTAVFLGVGLIILAGTLAGGLARGVHAGWDHVIARRARSKGAAAAPAARPHPGSHALLMLAVMGVPLALGAAVYAGTPDGYAGGWYREYPPCEMEALRDIAAVADRDPTAVVMTGDWEAKLVLAALTTDASRVWYKQTFFTLERSRGDTIAQLGHQGRTLIVVLDRYVKTETPDAQTDFLQQAPFHSLGTWCSNNALGQSRMMAYTTSATAGGA